MRSTAPQCFHCHAPPEFLSVTEEPGTKAKITFCGRCHKVQSNGADNASEPVDNLKEFAKSFSKMMLHASGVEVMAGVFLEGFKTGIEKALSVPWSQKELYWMEKYGVVAKDLLKQIEGELATMNEMEKTADEPTKVRNADRKADLEAKAREIRATVNEQNSVIR